MYWRRSNDLKLWILQWFPNRGPRAKSGPPILWMWPATVTHKFWKKIKLPCFLDFRFKSSSFFLLFCFNLISLFVKLYAAYLHFRWKTRVLSCIVVNWHLQYAKNMFHSMSEVTKMLRMGKLTTLPQRPLFAGAPAHAFVHNESNWGRLLRSLWPAMIF